MQLLIFILQLNCCLIKAKNLSYPKCEIYIRSCILYKHKKT
jgi:hypothetical protein